MKRKVTTLPSSVPVSVADVKTRLVIDTADDDTLIAGLIDAAVSWAEQYTNRPIMSQVITYYFDTFPTTLELYTTDIISAVVKYDDENDTEQTLASSDYYFDSISYPATIDAVNGFPNVSEQPNSVRVEVTAGHALESTVPDAIKTGILLMVGHLYANREGEVTGTISSVISLGVESFLDKYKVHG